MIKNQNKRQHEQTATPDKYPQGYFKEKMCKLCSGLFIPKAPSHLYCSQQCADSANTNRYYLKTYGITRGAYLEMLVKQDGKCAICRGTGFLMRDSHKTLLLVDHDHTTGRVRGLLCHNCNRALGLLHDSTENLLRAIEYLEGATTIRKE